MPVSERGGEGAATVAARAVEVLRRAGLTVATCESLTAGMAAAEIATVPGASAVLRGGLVVYATDLKAQLAGVDPQLLAARGPVDPEVAAQLARGAAQVCGADVGISCTGVAGPDPQDGKPVGLVYTGLYHAGDVEVREYRLSGDRAQIRSATVTLLLQALAELA